jgi:molybdenum cofactor biosynthesis enzyme MoaA
MSRYYLSIYLPHILTLCIYLSHFCGGCNRLRVTADGRLKVCLFGEESYSLLDSYRHNDSDVDIHNKINQALSKKKFSLGGIYLSISLSIDQLISLCIYG